MNNDKITDEEIDALDNVDLLELGHNFLGKGDGQRALKCFLRAAEPDKSRFSKIIGLSAAAEIYRDGKGGVPVDGHKAIDLYKKLGDYDSDLCVAEIYAKGCGDLLADGYKALEIYREMIRSIEVFVQDRWNMFGDSGVKFAVTEDYLGEDYPYYIQALRGQAEIYRYGLGGVPADGHKVIECYEKIGGYDSDFKIAEIYADGCGDLLADGYKALEIYRHIMRRCGDGTKVAIFVQKLFKMLGEDRPLEWEYPPEEYLKALFGQAEIFRFGTGGVPADGRKALKYYKRIVKLVFGTLDIHSLDDDEKFKRILADGEYGHQYAVRALGDISNMHRDGEAGIRPNPRKAEKFYELATYVESDYFIDENFQSWRHNEDEREFD